MQRVCPRAAAGGGTNLRAWSMADGALLWEHVLPTGGATGSTGGFGAGTVAGDKVFSHEAAMAAIAAARAAEASSDDPAVTEAAAEAAVKAAAKGLAGTAGDAGGGADANATEGSSSMVVLAAGEGRPAPLLVAFTHGRVFVRPPRPSLQWRGSMWWHECNHCCLRAACIASALRLHCTGGTW